MQYRDLFAKKGVHAVGRGKKSISGRLTSVDALVVSVEKKLPKDQVHPDDLIPVSIEGLVTDVIQRGPFRALASGYEARVRPVQLGYSLGHYAITAGTLGCFVEKNGLMYVLSNNHVMANSNAASIGDAILQPGAYDGGRPEDWVALLSQFIEIKFIGAELPSQCNISKSICSFLSSLARMSGSRSRFKFYAEGDLLPVNYVDAALALIDPEIVDLVGNPATLAVANLGDALSKTGRTTGRTTGVVEQVGVAVQVQYGEGKIAYFENQFMAGAMSAGGDSGSAVLNSKGELVGLLFAGSEDTTIINRIQEVSAAFGGISSWYVR